MKDPMFLTIVFVVLSALIATFIRRVKRDKCLKDFSGYNITLESKEGKLIWGSLRVFNTGLEFVYPELYGDKDGHVEGTFLVYKHEYPSIVETLIRYHDELTEENKKKRLEELEKAYHPKFFRRLKRKICNVIRTVKDSVMEVLNLLLAQAKTKGPAKGVLASQDKYVSQMKESLIGAVGTSYEPMLERYIGHRVVLELVKGEEVLEVCGILKEYTADFTELMDVGYKAGKETEARAADLVVPRKIGIVRHLAEMKPKKKIEILKNRKNLFLVLSLVIVASMLFSLAIVKWGKINLIKKEGNEEVKALVDVNESKIKQ